jgi:hypothetical protein
MSIRLYPLFPQSLYLPTDSTQDSFTLTAGRKTVTNSNGRLYVGTSTVHRIVPLNGARGAAIQFIGTDANNETITAVKVWTATFADSSGEGSPTVINLPSAIDLNQYGATGVITLGNINGATGDVVPATSFVADTIADWATTALGTVNEAVYALGESAAYSPASDAPATLIIPNFGPNIHGFVLEFDIGTAASANAVYTLTA